MRGFQTGRPRKGHLVNTGRIQFRVGVRKQVKDLLGRPDNPGGQSVVHHSLRPEERGGTQKEADEGYELLGHDTQR